jgi:hypothetical protein
MLKMEVERGPGGAVLIIDSITKVAPADKGAIVVSASHGDALDMWECGVISHLNPAALALGLKVGEPLRDALRRVALG